MSSVVSIVIDDSLASSASAGCDFPADPENGYYRILDPFLSREDKLLPTTKIQYSCNKGFVITTESEAKCVNGFWTVQPTCERVKVVCYFLKKGTIAFFYNYTLDSVNPDLCTHLIYAYNEINFEVIGTDNPYDVLYKDGNEEFRDLVNFKNNTPSLKVLTSIAGKSSQFSNSFNTDLKRESFANHTLKFLLDFGYDGLLLIWEYPGYFGGNSDDRDTFTDLIKVLSLSFYKNNMTLSAVISANEKIIETAYNIREINKYLDIMLVNSYELVEEDDGAPGICAPVYPYTYGHDDKFLTHNFNATFHKLLNLGASSHNIVLGVGLFGKQKNLTIHPGLSECPPPGVTFENIAVYYQICEAEYQKTDSKYFFTEALGPVIAVGHNWITYENKESLKHKLNFIVDNNLGGVSTFSINMDDYDGHCESGKYPLQSFIYKTLTSEESEEVSVTTSLARPIKQDTASSVEIGCTLPEYPFEGSYSVENLGNNRRVGPGDIVPPFTFLTYKCNRNYYPTPEVSYCDNDVTWSASPVCYSMDMEYQLEIIIPGSLCSLNGFYGDLQKGKCLMPKSLSIDFTCWDPSGSNIVCTDKLDSGTVVKSRCKSYYRNVGSYFYDMTCQDGIFDVAPPKCEPDCGSEPSVGEPQIIEGQTVKRGAFPWHVSVYHKDEDSSPDVQYNYICGGTIVKAQLILSAAHCFYSSDLGGSFPPSWYAVAAGKLTIDWATNSELEPYIQTSEIRNIFIPEQYRGTKSSHHADIAILHLKIPLEFSELVHPACINLNDANLDKIQLRSGNYGKVAGWGYTSEEGGVSQELRYLNVPKISYELCFNETLQFNFVKYLTLDKLCGGYTNGSSVCKGDSGGGLVFPFRDFIDRIERWYVRGIVSVTPARMHQGVETCNKDTYTAYTHVYFWKDWLTNIFNELKV